MLERDPCHGEMFDLTSLGLDQCVCIVRLVIFIKLHVVAPLITDPPPTRFATFFIYFFYFQLILIFFKAKALLADAFYKSICPYVCLCVCLCLWSLLTYRFNIFFPPLPRYPNFLEVRNPWGKVKERNGLTFENFY